MIRFHLSLEFPIVKAGQLSFPLRIWLGSASPFITWHGERLWILTLQLLSYIRRCIHCGQRSYLTLGYTWVWEVRGKSPSPTPREVWGTRIPAKGEGNCQRNSHGPSEQGEGCLSPQRNATSWATLSTSQEPVQRAAAMEIGFSSLSPSHLCSWFSSFLFFPRNVLLKSVLLFASGLKVEVWVHMKDKVEWGELKRQEVRVKGS